ncbi:MAG: DUF2382 domain-containing protein [Janthinobacterium lividum]
MDSLDTHIPGDPIPIVEEVATVSKRTVTTGITSVRKAVESSEYVVSELLKIQGASIDRVALGTAVDIHNPPQTRVEEGVTIIPVLEEVLVVEKRLILKEELRIRHHVNEVLASQEITLRTESLVLERREIDPGQQDLSDGTAFSNPISKER